MSVRPFFDTNVLLYTLKDRDPRADRAEQLVAAGGVISVQVLNEFCSVARGKLGLAWPEVDIALAGLRSLFQEIVPLTADLHDVARAIAQRYAFHIYDAAIVAAAVEAGCDVLYSEDLHAGQSIRGVIVRNPFIV